MIQRLNPDFGYLDPDDLDSVGMSQVVVADGVVHWSGIVAATGRAAEASLPAVDMTGQLTFILDRLDACLACVGTDRTHILTLTMFCTQLGELSAALRPIYASWVGDHRPTLTVIGVAELAFPGIRLEVQGSALMPR